ncbi:short-chain dehydrogenase [Corynebacterium stationis]|uniref:Short-chain dehydrogenase n=2 Tax=Corynebacterium stationis TaxID=1705 RepID=A0A177IUK6_9CORY|nr:SDR family oxidoreductase [Corynebacterium stationis]OAH32529.1 short-chain dehydrogenase [Corynebacterium stationis]
MTEVQNSKIAVVTGATGGMGKEIVANLVSDHHVYALGRDQAKLDELVAAHGDAVTVVAVDLAQELDAMDSVLPALERVDVLVNGAAIAQAFSVESARVSDWRAHMELNVYAPAELTRVLLPGLRKAEGTAIFINSGAGRGGFGDNVVYAATKHALYALADGLRKSEQDIRVTTIAPGPTDTAMFQGLSGDYDKSHVIAPVEIAKAIRAVIDAGPTTQLTEVQVRPRIELADRK